MVDLASFLIDTNLIAEDSFEWGTLKWLCNDSLSPGSLQTVGWCKILPGCSNPLHYHPNCEETLWVMQGQGKHSFDGQELELKQGTLLRIPIGVQHNFANTGTSMLECLITFSAGNRQTIFV